MTRIIRGFRLIVLPLFLLATTNAWAQTDTLRLSFKDAEKRFLENNFSLLAQKYNVDAAKALIEQAGLWDNPVLSTDQNITDNSHRFFNHSGDNGQIYVQFSQLIQTAGKRGKQIRVAEDATKVQEAAFNDLLRNLRYNLQLDFAQIANLVDQNGIYIAEINATTQLVNALDKSYQAGNASLKDVVRLKALLFNLQNEQVENNRQLNNLQKELKIILAADPGAFIRPVIANIAPLPQVSAENLIEQAIASRGDHMVNKYALAQSNDELILQKALAKPDVTVGASYDQNSSYTRHVVGLQISMPIPLFNRNQGNIKYAALAAKSQEIVVKNSEQQVRADVYSAAQQYQLSRQLLSKTETDFYERYDNIFNAMLKSFQQRQISLPEFIDFFDSYKETKIKILQLQLNLQKAVADLNYAVGTNVVSIS